MRFQVGLVVALVAWTTGASASHGVDDVAVGPPVDAGLVDRDGSDAVLDRGVVEVGPLGTPESHAGPDPSAPWGLVAYPSPEGVRLDWMAPSQGAPDGYNVYRSVDGREPVLLAHTQETEYTDPEVQGTVRTFVYHVTATYGPAESAASNPAVYVTGPLSCTAFHVYPDAEGNRTPPVDYGVNEHYLDCVLRGLGLWG